MKFIHNEILKKHTSFRIGGPANYFASPRSFSEIQTALIFAREQKLPVSIIGAGTNLLALDKGFNGLAIKLAGGLKKIKFRGNIVYAEAGAFLSQLISLTAKKGLSGLECLSGIPGTLGGAVVMNAGAWGKEIGRYVVRIKVFDRKGKEKIIQKKKMGFGYRKSILQKKNYIITEVVLKLRKGKKQLIKQKIKDYLDQRKAHQPLGIPNAGSIFKNPVGKFAGKLIEEAGGKGMRVGDAQVSTKHANFIVNLGEAKARDVIKLMTQLQKLVKDKHKIKLEPELKIM